MVKYLASKRVPQGSVLGPLLFLIYVNDMVKEIKSNIRLFADDTSIYKTIEDPYLCNTILNEDLNKINTWASEWLVTFNAGKTVAMTFSHKRHPQPILPFYFNNVKIDEVKSHKHLGLYFDPKATWHDHLKFLIGKLSPMINCFRSLKYRLSRKALTILYTSFILPVFDYGDVIWDNCSDCHALENLHLDALRTICSAVRGTSHDLLYQETGFISLSERWEKHKLILMFKMINKLTPQYLSSLVPQTVSSRTEYNLRNINDICSIKCRTQFYARTFLPSTINMWNHLGINILKGKSLKIFKRHISHNDIIAPNYYNHLHNQHSQVIHSKLRLRCSDLNSHKFKRFVSEFSNCECGHGYEDNAHYLLYCPRFITYRNENYRLISHLNINEKLLLFGNPQLSFLTNCLIFDCVQKFIESTKRFV